MERKLGGGRPVLHVQQLCQSGGPTEIFRIGAALEVLLQLDLVSLLVAPGACRDAVGNLLLAVTAGHVEVWRCESVRGCIKL